MPIADALQEREPADDELVLTCAEGGDAGRGESAGVGELPRYVEANFRLWGFTVRPQRPPAWAATPRFRPAASEARPTIVTTELITRSAGVSS
jgi:hypothetical protein